MARHKFSNLEKADGRHPGLCRQVEAMLKALIPVRAIARALRAQYGEPIGRATLYEYKWECWSVWRPGLGNWEIE
jgi:hypothetical protein